MSNKTLYSIAGFRQRGLNKIADIPQRSCEKHFIHSGRSVLPCTATSVCPSVRPSCPCYRSAVCNIGCILFIFSTTINLSRGIDPTDYGALCSFPRILWYKIYKYTLTYVEILPCGRQRPMNFTGQYYGCLWPGDRRSQPPVFTDIRFIQRLLEVSDW